MKKIRYVLISFCLLVCSSSLSAIELINCLTDGGPGGGDNLNRSFYVDGYPGFTLDSVILFLSSTGTGESTYRLTARSASFDGEVLGQAEVSYTRIFNDEPVPLEFDFRRAPVTFGQIVTFDIEQLSGPFSFFSVGNTTDDCVLIETVDSEPPLSTPRSGNGVAAIIQGADVPIEASMASLENPPNGGMVSGINTISGWVCDAERVEVEIDGTVLVEAAYGTPRGDTTGVCGNADNGFGVLVNWGILGDGVHNVRLLADDIEVGTSTFTVTTLGVPFLAGANGAYNLIDFPEDGQQVVIEWLQSQQGFVITEFFP